MFEFFNHKKKNFYCNYKQSFIEKTGAGRFLEYISNFSSRHNLNLVDDYKMADILLLGIKFDEIESLSNKQKVIARFDAIDVNFIEGTKKLFERADKAIFQTHHGLKLYKKFFGKIVKPYEVILNGAPIYKVNRKKKNNPVMLSVGTWADIPAYKPYYSGSPKISDLIKAILYFPKILKKINMEWWVVGEYLPQKVVDISQKYPQLKLLGRLEKNELMKVYKQADFMFHPGQNDNCPNSVVEALVTSMPIIYFKSGGVPELVYNAGIGIKSNDMKQFVNAVMQINENYDEFYKLAKQRSKEIDIKVIQKKYWDFILN